jgi:hypothetical protein
LARTWTAFAEASLLASAITELTVDKASRNCGAKPCREGGRKRAALTTWRPVDKSTGNCRSLPGGGRIRGAPHKVSNGGPHLD